jgi:hypothetical protein
LTMRPYHRVLLSVLFVTAIVGRLSAGGHCCKCGCDRGCDKVCRLVCEEKKVNIICWGCKCEDFCLPCHSHRGCKHCENVCDEDACDPDAPCAQAKPWVWYDWDPSCKSHIYPKKRLMRKTVVKTIPWYKWEVEELCCECQQCCPCAQIEPGFNLPDPPAIAVKLIYGRDGQMVIEDRLGQMNTLPLVNTASTSNGGALSLLPSLFAAPAEKGEPVIRVLR